MSDKLEVQKPLRESGAAMPPYLGPKEGHYVDVSLEVLRGMLEDGNEIRVKVTKGLPAEAVIIAVDVDWHRQTIRLHFDREVQDPILQTIP